MHKTVPRRYAGRQSAVCLAVIALTSVLVTDATARPEGPPATVCGTVLFKGPPGATVTQFLYPGQYEMSRRLQAEARPGGIPYVLQFQQSCSNGGVVVTLSSRSPLQVYSVARLADHRLAAIAVIPRREGVVRVTAHRPHKQQTVVTIHIAPPDGSDQGDHIRT
jgi:hypothetical protein